ncbi:VWA domain-containing protein [Roseimicrobium sp. ORNL1]|uniref:vWA domain-containing protein n=1 Tax=Roseimicrobium sp. ORNL1 TaxID=2711231 RepID=UPI0013E0FB01|nr:VWA domain-containing protein [Roseimicrobium sp. ORNL1]QIF05326.1 VWA domain-containing protein [Roseimicrobium sp. ORNL1]
MMDEFHFIRPWWLLALVLALIVWWLLRRHTDAAQSWRGIVAPHLLPHLLSGNEHRAKFRPLDLIAIGWLVSTLAVAGPTWRREPTPFAEDTAALAIVIKVSPSMMTEDVQPSRLARATEKVHDLLKDRAGAKTSLIAYAGTAHVVMPLTSDGGIIDTFAQSLDPKIMPEDGDVAAEAMKLAEQSLKDAGSGSILWITDSIAPEQATPLATWHKSSPLPVRLLPALYPGAELDAVRNASGAAGASVVLLSPGDADVHTLARSAKFAAALSGGDPSSRWQEAGYWLTPLLALLFLPFFRRGWMVPTASASR